MNHIFDKYKIEIANKDDWIQLWADCKNPNLIQSWQYGDAKKESERWSTYRFIVRDNNHLPIALVQVLVFQLPFLGGFARINRGPLLIHSMPDGQPSDIQVQAEIIKLLILEARSRRWWVLQISPEILDNNFNQQMLKELGLRPLKKTKWGSGIINLKLSSDEIEGRLNRRWKRILLRCSNNGVLVRPEILTEARLRDVLIGHENLQKRNKFTGISSKLIEQIARQDGGAGWKVNLYVAFTKANSGHESEELGYRLTISTGSVVVDFVVNTTERGREMEANSALYWYSIIDAKNNGYSWFDIGGLNEDTPKGIAEFKIGLGANLYKLVGEYQKIMLPFTKG